MANTKEVTIQGNEVWVAPIHDFTKADTESLLDWTESVRSPVVDLIGMSGECKCGAFAQPGELEELNQFDITRPLYRRIKQLEKKVMGIHPWGWEDSPPNWSLEKKAGQTFMFNYDQPMCWNCNIQRQQMKLAVS